MDKRTKWIELSQAVGFGCAESLAREYLHTQREYVAELSVALQVKKKRMNLFGDEQNEQ